MQLKPNTLLQGGKYRIVKELGSGGFGITYKAVQVALNRYVAIKEFFMKDFCVRGNSSTQMSVGSEGSRDLVERYRKKFVKEARTIAQFKHPHIIGIHDVFEENGTAYYVMDFLEEGSLNDYLEKQGRLSETEALYYIRQIASALDYIHQQNINHLDVKPGNIMLDEKHNAVLIDFGLAKSYDGDGNQESTTPVGVSAGYAPTEQYMRGGVGKFSPETDIYSLGATLYKLVTGKIPPEAQEVTDYGLPTFPSFVSRQVAAAITQAMQPRRVDRPHSIEAFLNLLQEKVPSQSKLQTESHLKPFLLKLQLKKWKYAMGVLALAVVAVFLIKFVGNEDATALYARGMEFYENKEYTEAVKLFKEAADQDHADSQYNLGVCYENGRGVTVDMEEAVKWYRKSAEQGERTAQHKLGDCYYYGIGITQDLSEGVRWYRKAADQKHSDAQNNLGDCYHYGDGVTKDFVEAAKWYRKSAEQGHPCAQYNLGYCYAYGEGVTKDLAEAAKWYRKSAEQGHPGAQNNLGYCYEYGKGVTKDLAEAVKWYRKAADQEYSNAQNNLGYCYEYGKGVTKDLAEAVKWYRKSAEQGHPCAQYNLGCCYEYGEGVTKDLAEAAKWYRKSAEQGYARAQNNLGVCYALGKGVTKDLAEAVKWYRKAADQEHSNAQFNLGFCYDNGQGVAKNQSEAVKWYRKAAEQGYETAQYVLGYKYEFGEGVPKNKNEALKWYREAVKQGSKDAEKRIKKLTILRI